MCNAIPPSESLKNTIEIRATSIDNNMQNIAKPRLVRRNWYRSREQQLNRKKLYASVCWWHMAPYFWPCRKRNMLKWLKYVSCLKPFFWYNKIWPFRVASDMQKKKSATGCHDQWQWKEKDDFNYDLRWLFTWKHPVSWVIISPWQDCP